MSERIALAASAALAILVRDWHAFRSYRLRAITSILGVVFSLTLFYYISRLVRVEPFGASDSYYAFAVVGLLMLQLVNATLAGAPATFRGEIAGGTFERLLISPFGATGGMLAMQIFPVLNAMFLAATMLVFGDAVFGLDVRWASAALAVPVAALAALAFTPFSLLLLAGVVLVKQASAGVTWIVALISLVAGLYFPIDLLPPAIRWASDVQPFTPAVDLLRNVLVGTPLDGTVLGDLARLVGFAAILLPPSIYALKQAVDLGRRRGTILEF